MAHMATSHAQNRLVDLYGSDCLTVTTENMCGYGVCGGWVTIYYRQADHAWERQLMPADETIFHDVLARLQAGIADH